LASFIHKLVNKGYHLIHRIMGFSPALVGLSGPISGTFNEPRPGGCPHRGLDISSNGISTPFSAGIYGTVIAPTPGASQWCTIAVKPFDDPTVVVQYLHCSSTNVNLGDIVAPWTILGTTGNCSPTPVPIHLHIQVIYPGAPANLCWNQNFVDPQTWNIVSPMLGGWSCTDVEMGNTYLNTVEINSDASSGVIGTIESSTSTTVTLPNGAQCELGLVFKYDLVATSYTQKNKINIIARFTSGEFTNNPCNLANQGITAADISFEATLDSEFGLTFKNLTAEAQFLLLFTRGGAIPQNSTLRKETSFSQSDNSINVVRKSNSLIIQNNFV
jgi:hypothetical protein